jgi:GntR family transcriptional regulator/MocR family aminotransferase
VISLPQSASDADLARRALPFGLAPSALSPWYVGSGVRQGLLLGVTNLDVRRLPEDCRRLADLVR